MQREIIYCFPEYDKISWRNSLSEIFSGRKKCPARALIRGNLGNFNRLRNCVSHCESVVSESLPKHYHQLIKTLSWINPAIADWLDKEINFIQLICELRDFYTINDLRSK